MKTLQQTFDIVSTHLLAQGAQSRKGHSLAYHGEQGRRDAIGVLIPDSKYTPDLEGIPLEQRTKANQPHRNILIDEGYLTTADWPVGGRPSRRLKLLKALQDCHDSYSQATPDKWPDQLTKIAKDFNLEPYHA